MSHMIQPKEVTIETQDGVKKTYVLSKIPAIACREIVANYPLSALPKVGDYKTNEETMLKLMAFVAVVTDAGAPILLTNRALIDNHVPDWETLARIEIGMLEYNVSFFGQGRNSDFFKGFVQKGQALITKMLTDSLAPSSRKDVPPSTN